MPRRSRASTAAWPYGASSGFAAAAVVRSREQGFATEARAARAARNSGTACLVYEIMSLVRGYIMKRNENGRDGKQPGEGAPEARIHGHRPRKNGGRQPANHL